MFFGFKGGLLVRGEYSALTKADIQPMTTLEVVRALIREGTPLSEVKEQLKAAPHWPDSLQFPLVLISAPTQSPSPSGDKDSLCGVCDRPCLGVGVEGQTRGVPSCVWSQGQTGQTRVLKWGEVCRFYFPSDPMDPKLPLPSTEEGLEALHRATLAALAAESPC